MRQEFTDACAFFLGKIEIHTSWFTVDKENPIIYSYDYKIFVKYMTSSLCNSSECLWLYAYTYFLNFCSILEGGVPKTSCILAIWSTSFEPGKSGCKLKRRKETKGNALWICECLTECKLAVWPTSWPQKRHTLLPIGPFYDYNSHL